MNFESHIENICCRASFLTLEQAKVLAETYILSNFRYCQLVWMFCGKCGNNVITKTHHRCLRAIYNTQTKTYHYLLRINGNIDIHTQNIQILMTEIYKCLNKISPPFTWEYYIQNSNHCNLIREHLLKLNKCRTKTYGLNTAVFKGAVIWNNLSNHFKEVKSLTELKTLIREWTQISYTCCTCS